MKYVFWGTPVFAARILEILSAGGIPPLALVCNPDKPTGRKRIITPPPAKEVALKNNLKIFQPEKPGDVLEEIQSLAPDFYVVAAYSHILRKDILDIPAMGTVGVHPSLLPDLRGATPIQSSILRGDEVTGVSLFLIDEKMDHGPILAQEKIPIGNLEYPDLQNRLAELSGKMLLKYLPPFREGKIKPQPQRHDLATFTAKFSREDGFIEPVLMQTALSGESWEMAQEINNKIRALGHEPGIWTLAKSLKLLGSNPEQEIKIIHSHLDEGRLILDTIQIPGKNPQPYKN